MLATKLRALLQRNKARDLFDLAHAINVFPGLNSARVVECLGLYLQKSGIRISRAEAEMRMFAKLRSPNFVTDIRPLVSAEEANRLNEASTRAAFQRVFSNLVILLPGNQWAKTEEMKSRFGISF
jgi:hypothetical protein